MTADRRHAFVTSLAGTHGDRLRRYLASRLRGARNDIPDLVQEVFFRLWRIQRPDSIQNPEAYLFTIANHVLHQYALKQSVAPASLGLVDMVPESAAQADPLAQAELQQRLQEIDDALQGLSAKAHAALVLYRRDGFSLEEIAHRLGVSRGMVKKYIAKAILHCRQRIPMEEQESA